MIFAEPLHGIAHSAQDPFFQIVDPPGMVDDDAPERIAEQGIDGEITPDHIQCGIFRVKDRFRMSAVGIFPFLPEGGDFVWNGIHDHRHDPERYPQRDGVFKKSHDLIGCRIGGDIQVFRDLVQQQIPDAAAHKKCLMAVIAEDPDHREHPLPLGGSGRICLWYKRKFFHKNCTFHLPFSI